jgi:hypothetical protein
MRYKSNRCAAALVTIAIMVATTPRCASAPYDSGFKVRASRILSFEGSVPKLRKILHSVQDGL